MVAMTWLGGLLTRRRARVVSTALGVAVAVALLASIGAFLSATTSKMTTRAVAGVPVDWQVEVQTGSDPQAVLDQVGHRPGVRAALPVTFASTTGLTATAGGSTQQTGPGTVLGLPPGYARTFPGEVRGLSGATDGVLLAQQTAANLHARPGETVTIGLSGGHSAKVKVDGVVDLPAADSLFQKVGAPPGAQPQAPPDNVILLPSGRFDAIVRGVPVVTQIHTRISHHLPAGPSPAYTSVTGRARNLETRLAGAGLVGDNIGTALDSPRQDGLYAQMMFLFLRI